MSAGSVAGIKARSIVLFVLVFFCAPLTPVAEGTADVESEVGKRLLRTIREGVPFEGVTTSLDGTQVWHGFLFIRLKEGSLEFDGHLEWTSLNHVNYIEGTITETGSFVEVDFTSTKTLVKGNAATGVDYHAIALIENDQVQLLGRWSSGHSRGPFEMTVNPTITGQQSSLLGGKSVDDMLANQADQEQAGKPQVVWQEDCLDWKIDGFEYPNSDRFLKMTCNWARNRLSDGPSTGEMMIIVTKADESPMLAFRYKSHNQWKKHMPELDHIDIYFSEDVQYRLPVDPQDNGWVYSTDPAMVRRIVGSAKKDAQHIDSDMIVYTGIQGLLRGSLLNSNISTKGLTEVWIAGGYFMKGEQPPSILEIMQRDDH